MSKNEKTPILQLNHVTKTFPGVKALQEVDFSLYPGEVHVLAGENGAGKSTLTKCLLGVYQPEEGEILFAGEKTVFRNTREAMEEGIVAVYQELTMIPYLDAAQNIFFHREAKLGKTPILDRRKMYEDAGDILKTLHCEFIDLHTPVCKLSVAQQQMIEIAKALSRNPKVILFDEPTTSLTSNEVSFLFEQIRELRRKGIAILFISHRIPEMREIGDRITILRDGKCISSCFLEEISDDELIETMIGRKDSNQEQKESSETLQRDRDLSQKKMLEVTGLSDQAGKIHSVSFSVNQGEIVGFAGLVGSGRTEIANLLYGIDKISSGNILFRDKTFSKTNPHEMASMGMGFLPEDRKSLGLALSAPIHWNILASSLKSQFPSGLLSHKKSVEISDHYVEDMKIATTDSNKVAEELSGGNQQKVVLSKWLAADSDFLIFDEPTRGIDVGAKQEIYHLLEELREKGKSILLISSEMSELMRVCDRIYGVSDGKIVGEICRKDFSEETIGKMLFQNEDRDQKAKSKEGKKRIPNRVSSRFMAFPPAFYMDILLLLFFIFNTEHFISISNLSNLLSQSAALCILACGQAMIVLIQGTDLSLGSIVSLIGVLWFFLLNCGMSMGISVLFCLICGAVCGLWNGILVAKGKIPIFIVTLGSQNILKSLALILCGSQTLYYGSDIFRRMAKGSFLNITYITWIAIACFISMILVFSFTDFGLRIRALGGNPQGITYSGGNVARHQIRVFVYAGIMAAMSGLVLCCRIESGNPNAGIGMEFNSIAAVLLGGISMREGKGEIRGIIYGVLLIQILKSGLTQIGMNSIYQNATIGIVVLFAIIIDAIFKKKQEKGGNAR